MIKEIILNGHPVKYQITFKNNKNTYFYFKNEGYIQINASRHQTHRQIFKYMKDNQVAFIEKYHKISKKQNDNKTYQLFGIKYLKETDELLNELAIDRKNKIIKEPNLPVDQLDYLYKIMEKKLMYKVLEEFKKQYANNPNIDLENLKFKTRYMQTRFGSCNPLSKVINLNLFLVRFDRKYLEYVFLHEIVHLVHHNHSKEYYDLLGKYSKDYKTLKKELNILFNNR